MKQNKNKTRRVNLLPLFAVLSVLLWQAKTIAQETHYSFRPKWEVGDKKTISISKHETSLRNDTIISDTTTFLPASIKVAVETKDYYGVEILMQNVAWQAVIDMYEKLGDELKNYQNLMLRYKVYKDGRNAELTNVKQLKNFMTTSIDQMVDLINKKVPEEDNFASIIFDPVKVLFKDEESIRQYANDEMGFMLYPYGKKLLVGDTMKVVTPAANPFNPMDTINETKLTWINQEDVSANNIKVHVSSQIDLAKFKKMMAQMMMSMMKSFGQSEEDSEEAKAEMTAFDMNVIDYRTLHFNSRSTWVDKVVFTGISSTTSPKGKTEKRSITTITIK